jgi:3-phenylpropionate/trans-cinnamate dioxygenase ferredoxin reductase subunit
MTQTCIIIGASHGAAQLIPSLRQEGWDGRILVISDDPNLPYHRPPLSKAYLSGEKTADTLAIRPAAFYEKQNAKFMLGHVDAIKRDNKTLQLSNAETLSYDKLALCTGARARKVELAGSGLQGIHYLRDMADAEAIKNDVVAGQQAVIVGGGYIGLETAASLTKLGMQVTVLEMADRILQRVTAPELSEFYHRIHTEHGVRILTNSSAQQFVGKERVEKVVCSDGTELDAKLVVIGIGVIPNTELAETAGLTVENGIVVDEFCQTNDPDIVAAGDCTSHISKIYGCRVRLESAPNASEQAKTAAATICGKPKGRTTLPWFWSDQYDLKLQIAGLSQGYDQVVIRGDKDTGNSFAAFYLKGGQLLAADCVNRPKEFMLSKRLITSGQTIPADKLGNESISVNELLPR